jgi:hypothetical protein
MRCQWHQPHQPPDERPRIATRTGLSQRNRRAATCRRLFGTRWLRAARRRIQRAWQQQEARLIATGSAQRSQLGLSRTTARLKRLLRGYSETRRIPCRGLSPLVVKALSARGRYGPSHWSGFGYVSVRGLSTLPGVRVVKVPWFPTPNTVAWDPHPRGEGSAAATPFREAVSLDVGHGIDVRELLTLDRLPLPRRQRPHLYPLGAGRGVENAVRARGALW